MQIIRVGGKQAYRALEMLDKNQSDIQNTARESLIKKYKIEARKAHFKNIYNS